jgi:hypothetical protein
MDQLKLVLEHKFWILAGLAILLPPIGWWAATGNLAQETDDRQKKIESSEKALAGVKDVPNDKWILGAKEIGKELSASVVESQQHLFEHQKGVMKFPPIVQNTLDKCHLKYRQDGSASTDLKVQKDFQAAKEFFVGLYDADWKDALTIVKPYKIRTGEGLVLLPLVMTSSGNEVSLITRHSEVEFWRQTMGFTSAQMYDVEEDVWFLRTLLQAIAKVNEGATEIGNARIKRVTEATLRGGDLSDLAARRAPKSGSGGTTSAASKVSGSMSVNLGRGSGGGGGGAQSDWKAPKNFDPDDVFGSDGSKESGAGEGRKKDSSASVELRRWADSSQKYNKRGFVLKLVMDEREIPTLLTAFSESPFPIEIKHVEHHAYANRSGAEFAQFSNALNETTDGAEQPSKEQQQQQHRILEGLRMAFNVNYLAEVTVAGTLTIYNEPAAVAASKSSAPAKAGTSQPATSGTQPKTGSGAAKTGPAAKAPATSTVKAAPAAGSPAAKTGAPVTKPAAAKAPPPAGKSATTGK